MLRDATAVIVKLLTRSGVGLAIRRGAPRVARCAEDQRKAAPRQEPTSGPLVLRRSPLPGDAALVGPGVTAAGPRDRPRQENRADEARDQPPREWGSRQRQPAPQGVEATHTVEDALRKLAASEGWENQRVHDLTSAAVVRVTPGRAELDARLAVVLGDQQEHAVAEVIRPQVPDLEQLGRVSLDRIAGGLLGCERSDGGHGHRVPRLFEERGSEPVDLLTMLDRDQPDLVADDATGRRARRERYLSPTCRGERPGHQKQGEQHPPGDRFRATHVPSSLTVLRASEDLTKHHRYSRRRPPRIEEPRVIEVPRAFTTTPGTPKALSGTLSAR